MFTLPCLPWPALAKWQEMRVAGALRRIASNMRANGLKVTNPEQLEQVCCTAKQELAA